MTSLEHVNVTVPDIDAAVAFIQIVAPDFVVRQDQFTKDGYRWVHIGNKQSYIALQEPHVGSDALSARETYTNYGINHIGLVVDDLAQIEQQLNKDHYKRGIEPPKESFRKRAYYFDQAGFEWELIEYASNDPEKKYRYE